MDSSINIQLTLLKLYEAVLDIKMEGMLSQIFYLGPSFYFIDLENLFYKFLTMFADFGHKIKTRA